MSIEEQLHNAALNIAVIRGARGLSALEVSRDCSLRSANRVGDIEYGRAKITLEEIIAIADYFQVSVDGLLKQKAKIIFE